MPFHFCFLSFFFSVTLPAVRISLLFQFQNLVSTEDVADPGLLKIPWPPLVCHRRFWLHKCPWYWAAWSRNFIAQSWVINIKYSARLSSMFVRNRWEIYTSSPPNKDGKMVHFGFWTRRGRDEEIKRGFCFLFLFRSGGSRRAGYSTLFPGSCQTGTLNRKTINF